MHDLEENGYAVIPEVCAVSDCDSYVAGYHQWLEQFDQDRWPCQMQSIIQDYYIGHFENTWKARLKAKPVFSKIWHTEKLLTSFDGVAISFPPESVNNGTYDDGKTWFHLDQSAQRKGLHAYQGALYLEETTETDYCFRVMTGSHKHTGTFYEEFETAAFMSNGNEFYKLKDTEKSWYRDRGCVDTKVPVPKGGMVLWDSRTVHDNCRPTKGRPNSDRWRFVVFVCMTPARWARDEDMEMKKVAYKDRKMTAHWPSQGTHHFGSVNSSKVEAPIGNTLPDVAKTDEARLLSGDLEYDFHDEEPNGPDWDPEWIH